MYQKFAAILLALAAVCALTGCVQQPTPFEEPKKHTFPTVPTVAIRTPEQENLTPAESTPSAETQEEEQVFVLGLPSGEPCIMTKVFYGADGIVTHIYGEIFFRDQSVADIDSLKNDVEVTEELADEYDLSGINISVDEDDNSYLEVFHFLYLDEVPENAQLAAAFIGFEAENGKITIEKVTEAMNGYGYTKQ